MAELKEESEDQKLSLHLSDLIYANFIKANLTNAIFAKCNLEGAFFTKVNYKSSVFLLAKMENVKLIDAHLEGAMLLINEGLTSKQIKSAFIDKETIIDTDIAQELFDEYEKGNLPYRFTEVMEKKKKLKEEQQSDE